MQTIQSHKTAIRRFELSRPLKQALTDGVLRKEFSFFDYGCGYGDDISFLKDMGFVSKGWDPAHSPESDKQKSCVVNIGYVINVIDNINERKNALIEAFSLADKLLIVSAMLDNKSNQAVNIQSYADGYITSRQTFQKLFTQVELKDYLTLILEEEAFPAAPGIFYIFKDHSLKEEFLQNRVSRHYHFTRRSPLSLQERYAEYKDLLEEFMDSIYKLGRLPKEEEFLKSAEIKKNIGSFKKAFSLIQSFFPENLIEECKQRRYNDLLVYLALAHFRKVPRPKDLSPILRNDMKIFFGNYKVAKELGKDLLFSAGDASLIAKNCRASKIGKILPEDLYIHKEYIDHLSPLLRVYVGCADAFIGNIEEANIIKIHMHSGKVSYLEYEDFDTEPHPRLLKTTTVKLRELKMKEIDYSQRENPPILHRKETFVGEDYPQYKSFKKLSQDEEKAGLLDFASSIGTKKKWEERLNDMGFTIKGHKLVSLK